MYCTLPPSLDFARLRTPPSKEAFRHSGGDKRRCTSATVTWISFISADISSSLEVAVYDLVLGGGGEKREPSRRGAEDVCGQGHRLQGFCVCVTCSDLPEDTCVLILLHLLLILKRISQVSHLQENKGDT